MKARAHIWVAVISALSLAGMAAAAHAESARPSLSPPDNNVSRALLSDQGLSIGQPAQHSLQWDQKGRWGLKLDMSQPAGRDIQLRDVQAGAYYRVTPSLRVGGVVALGDAALQQPSDHSTPLQNQSQAPRVRLETSFKF